MDTRQKSCEERIGVEMASRFAEMQAAIDMDAENGDDMDEGTLDGLRQSLLEFTPRITVRLLLSTGGPADGFDIVLDSTGDMVSGEYFYQDWFDGARRPLDDDELSLVEAVYGPFDHLRITHV